ncbi:MAG: 4Fe-4S binding protein [Bacilli bacterium]|nr:4Fe-4S binding protein [Bacilli bacterium]
MSVLINKKRCDNAKECSCIESCPTKAFYWDEENQTIAVDNNLCINCRQCMIACEAGAIKVARTEEEYNKIKQEYDTYAMTIKELFQDRYGASIIDEKYSLELDKLDQLLTDSNKPLLIEFYNNEESMCLINSIPIKDIIKSLKLNVSYRKINIPDVDAIAKYGVTELPSLLVFNKDEIIYKQCGFVNIKNKEQILKQISLL